MYGTNLNIWEMLMSINSQSDLWFPETPWEVHRSLFLKNTDLIGFLLIFSLDSTVGFSRDYMNSDNKPVESKSGYETPAVFH